MLRILFMCSVVLLSVLDHAQAGGKGKDHDILKIHVPEIIKHQYHTHYVFIHKHAPVKKEPKKKEVVKHHHHKHIHIPMPHKHWYNVHKSKAHKHVATHTHGHGHGPPVIIKHVPKVHKVVHHKVVHHKKPVIQVHKPHVKKPPPPKKHHQDDYDYGYQVTEDYDEDEDPTIYQFDPDDYTIPGDAKDPHIETQPEDYNVNYFNYPANPAGPGIYSYYGSPEISSYDVPPYHKPKKHEDEVQYEYDYSRPPDSEFEFRNDVFKDAKVEEHVEDTPVYRQHRRRFINEINDVQRKTYGDENVQFSKTGNHGNLVTMMDKAGVFKQVVA